MEPIPKRQRTPNFSRYEIGILVDIVEKYKDVIENKKTDGVSVRKKCLAWQKVEEEFNTSPGTTQRVAEKLKTCYENTKRKIKQDLADEKMERTRTAGGTDNSKLDDTSNKIVAMLGPSATPTDNDDSDELQQDGPTAEEAVLLLDDSLPVLNINQPSDLKKNNENYIAVKTNLMQGPSEKSKCRSLPRSISVSSHTTIKDACCKRINLLEEELEIKRKEHLKEMEIKELKMQVLSEKLKYWKTKNGRLTK